MFSSAKLPYGWVVQPFPDAIDFQEGPGILAKDFRPSGVPLVRLSGLERGAQLLDGCNYLDPEMVRQKWAHFAVSEGDILLSTSASLGRLAVVDASSAGAIPYTGIIRMRPRHAGLRAPFIRYLLEAPDFQRQVEAMGAGSVIRHFGPTHLRQMRVIVPHPSVQDATVRMLRSLDDKIELNRRMNETLEEMARALFKSWFVDFDPVHAKAAGKKPYGMDESLASLFPNRLAGTLLGDVPHGWKIATLHDCLSTIIDHRGKTPSKLGGDWALSGGVPAISAKNVKSGRLVQLDSARSVDEDLYARWMPDELQAGDVLLTSEAPLGEMVYLAWKKRFCLSQRLFALRAEPTRCLPTYLYLWLKTDLAQADLHSRATGSTVLGIRQSELRKVRILLADVPVLEAFHSIAHSLLQRLERSEDETSYLSGLRDTLLPKLLSGELRIKDAEKLVGEAT